MEGDYNICDTFGEAAICEYKESLGEEHPRECYWEYKEEKIEVVPEEEDEGDDALTMSAMMINDAMPLAKKAKQMCGYRPFTIKIIEFTIACVLNCVPLLLARKSTPARIITWHDFPTVLYCLSAAPTLVLSLIFIILYMSDQIHDYAEQLYVLTELIINCIAIFVAVFKEPTKAVNGFYALLHIHLTLMLLIDMWLLVVERGCTLFMKRKVLVEIPCVPYVEEVDEVKDGENICEKHYGPPVCEDNPYEDQTPVARESRKSSW